METWPAMDIMVCSLALDDPASLVIAVWRRDAVRSASFQSLSESKIHHYVWHLVGHLAP